MKKNVIVSLADANYFPLLEELINSIRRFKESESIAICILDAGLTQEQKDKLNNKVYENVGMPHVLIDMQGSARSVCKDMPLIAENGGIKQDPLTGEQLSFKQCGFLEVDEGTGDLSAQEFDKAMLDLTNFLAYMTDPLKVERETIGTYVLLYLFIFTMLSYLLYREFKKDLH